MKRMMTLALAVLLLLTCSACFDHSQPAESQSPPTPTVSPLDEPLPDQEPDAGSSPEATEKAPSSTDSPPESTPSPALPADIDLTALSSTMVFAEVSNIMMSPGDYIGKTIRMSGIFSVYQVPETLQVHCGIMVQDAAACCAQGFEVILGEDLTYPQDYPSDKSPVTLSGTLQVDPAMEELGILFLRLEQVTIESP